MGRLIDADALIEALTGVEVAFYLEDGQTEDTYDGTTIMDIIDAQPTAYNVDAVVAELEYFAKLAEDRWVNGTSNHAYQEHKCWVKAIDIMKRGGVE